jgi:hypothetical protein
VAAAMKPLRLFNQPSEVAGEGIPKTSILGIGVLGENVPVRVIKTDNSETHKKNGKTAAKPVWVGLISLRKLFIRPLFKWLKKGLHSVGLDLSRVLC